MEIGTQAREALDGQRRHLPQEQQQLVQAGERENIFRIKSVEFRILFPKSFFERTIKERNALHENTGQRAHVAYQREAELKVQLRNAGNCCISMTESYEESSGQGHQALETSSRPGGVFREILSTTTSSENYGQEEPKKTRRRSGPYGRATTFEKKFSASVNASRKVKDSTSILEQIPPTTALSKTSSFLEKSTLKRKEVLKFEFEPWRRSSPHLMAQGDHEKVVSVKPDFQLVK